MSESESSKSKSSDPNSSESSEEDRRSQQREIINAVVGIDATNRTDRVGVTRNLSAKGALFHSASRFTPGETLTLLLRRPGKDGEHRVRARVVRTELNDPDSDSIFCHLTAVEFDTPLS